MKKSFFMLAAMLLVITGCSVPITNRLDGWYGFNKDILMAEKESYKVVVDSLEDIRPIEEKTGELTDETRKRIMFSKDEDYYGSEAPIQITRLLVKHLNKSGLFETVSEKNIANNILENPEEIDALQKEGFDLALTGKIAHSYGYMEQMAGETAGTLLLGPLYVLGECFSNPKDVGAKVEYKEVTLIDLKTKTVLWTGDIEYHFDKQVKNYMAPIFYILEAQKEVNNKLTTHLSDALNNVNP